MDPSATQPELAVEVRRSTVEEFKTSALSLMEAHWRELALDQDSVPLAPDWAAYEFMEKRGLLHALAAFVGDEMVGYCVSYLVPNHLHYSTHAFVQNDVFFVRPDLRGARVGAALMRAARGMAQRCGAAEMTWHVKPDTKLHEALAKSKRHVVRDIVYSEKL